MDENWLQYINSWDDNKTILHLFRRFTRSQYQLACQIFFHRLQLLPVVRSVDGFRSHCSRAIAYTSSHCLCLVDQIPSQVNAGFHSLSAISLRFLNHEWNMHKWTPFHPDLPRLHFFGVTADIVRSPGGNAWVIHLKGSIMDWKKSKPPLRNG